MEVDTAAEEGVSSGASVVTVTDWRLGAHLQREVNRYDLRHRNNNVFRYRGLEACHASFHLVVSRGDRNAVITRARPLDLPIDSCISISNGDLRFRYDRAGSIKNRTCYCTQLALGKNPFG